MIYQKYQHYFKNFSLNVITQDKRKSLSSRKIYKILVTNQAPEEHLGGLPSLAEIVYGPAGGSLMLREEVLHYAPCLDAIINQAELKVDAALLDVAPKLKIVANVASGIDNFDLRLMADRGVWATNTPEIFTESAADATFGLLLCLARRLAQADTYVRSGRWASDGFQPGVWEGMLLSGKTLGIVGYGKIGQAVARRARVFGMKVIYCRQTSTDDRSCCSLEELLGTADVISLHIPLNKQTRHLINAEKLERTKHGALLINMARGSVVDEAALVAALQSGRLGGAALDVFENEPSVHPALLTMSNVVLTPHLGGGTHESRRAARQLCAANITAVLGGGEPLTPVNRIAAVSLEK